MIKIIAGVYGYKENGIILPKDKDSEPFSLDPEREAELVAQGVAEYANVIIPEAELEPEPETAGAEQQPAEDPTEPGAEEPEQDLEPEAVNEGIISADSGVAGVSRTEMDELEMMEKPKVEKPEDKEIISVQEVDLDALFAETSSSLAKEAGEDAAEKAEEEPAVEEVTAEEIIGEPEEVVAEETVDTAGDVLEERVEGAVEIVTEEEPAETLTDAADEAMAAFEASLSGLSLDFAEETSSDAPETETSAEST